MKRWKWIIGSLLALLGLAVGGGWFALQHYLGKYLTADALVREVESHYACRASISSVEADVLSLSPRVVLSKVLLAARDDQVGKPLAERTPITHRVVEVGSIELLLDARPLADGRLHVKQLSLIQPIISDEISSEKVSMLGALFQKPQADLFAKALKQVQDAAAPSTPSPAKKPDDSPLKALTVDEVAIRDGKVHVVNRAAKTTTDVSIDRLRAWDVDIDLADLAHHNQCQVELEADAKTRGRARIGEEMQDVQLGQIHVVAQGRVVPFDPVARVLDPDARLALIISKGSKLGGDTTLGAAAGKDPTFANLKKRFGIDVEDLTIGGELQQDARAEAQLRKGTIEFIQDTAFTFPQYEVKLRKGSTIHPAADTMDLTLRMIPAADLAKRLEEQAAAKVGDGIVKVALGLFSDEAGHLAFDVLLTERLSKPKLKLSGKAGDIEQLIKGLNVDALRGIIGR